MTKEEAIKIIDGLHAIGCGRNQHECDIKTNEALDIAIEALSVDGKQGGWKHTITGQPYCSNCEYVFGEDEEFNPFWDYCPMCGAKIKGGDDKLQDT